MTHTERVVAALHATKKFHADYFQSCLEMRAGYQSQKRLGSFYPMMAPRVVEAALFACEWKLLEEHPDIAEPAVGFVTPDLGGMFGMVRITEEHLFEHERGAKLFLDDAKGTGFLSLVINRGLARETERSVIILGPDDQAGEMVWTFHPGPPAQKPFLAVNAAEGLVHGRGISVARAHALGFTHAKIA